MTPDRRNFIASAGALAAVSPFPARPLRSQDRGRIVVVGGGFGGGTVARFLAVAGHDVTLVERNATFSTCPFSNTVLGGLNDMSAIAFNMKGLAAAGVTVIRREATGVDPDNRQLQLAGDSSLPYDRLVLSPGIEMQFDDLPGYDDAAAQIMPHAWQAGPQTAILRSQLEAMDDGGTVVIAPPEYPFRCPPGPYERASLIAWYLKNEKPRSKILILDTRDSFSKQALFEEAWTALYPGMIDWVGLSRGGRVVEVDPDTMTIITDFEQFEADVANIIPLQRAGAIARAAGVTDRTGWCPVAPDTFESMLVPGIHVIGDACLAGAMPKSGFSANAQGKVVAAAIDAILRGEALQSPKLINTCYSLAAPDYGFSVAGVYEVVGGELVSVEGSGGVSPTGAAPEVRAAEADYARAWYRTITHQIWG
ncbi:NAD(P)/FAD-dependent oxidoreductase [Pseudoruegeria sp. HB172150]|uniref:NAD(P)/FAD-dependent oxidoreductase n=1 Tax=Pseudoruegeria sp. HB172150 TaxID=2721164 RepID=UPI0015525664|nr:NAD(P)/FAD-dependent oxidoreductase [Pseudoruegeria sp. HB172150]